MKKLLFFLPFLLLAACSKSDGPYSGIGGNYTALTHYRYYGASSSHDVDSTVIDYEGAITIDRIMPGKIKATWTGGNHQEATINLNLVRDTPDSLIFKVSPSGYESILAYLYFSKASKRFLFNFTKNYRSSPNYWVSECYILQARR
ncbi:hypothetical protein [Taibaiella helva]|uniref:hypothetical protein n=1 Tax=Taibaiella helva TaxID=2301235 RepID=UPI000E57F3A7|nr:hypothetical protein [Taibaiella helva]